MTKKTCAKCGTRSKRVRAQESNTGNGKVGARRCLCRNGCKQKKAAAS